MREFGVWATVKKGYIEGFVDKTLTPLVILVFLKCSVGDCGEPPKNLRKRLILLLTWKIEDICRS